MDRDPPKIRFHEKAVSPSGRELYLFLCNKTWVHQYRSDMDTDYPEVEEFLSENGGSNDWYWGGNRYLKDEERGFGLVITNPVLATHLMLSGLCHEA